MFEHKNKSRKAVRIPNKGDKLSQEEIEEGIRLEMAGAYDYTPPRIRAECVDGPRPCPWVSCKYHLYLDVAPTGAIVLNFPLIDPGDMLWSCSLDEAEADGMTLALVGQRVNITRERIRQIECRVLRKLRRMPGRLEVLERMRHLASARDATVVTDDGFIES